MAELGKKPKPRRRVALPAKGAMVIVYWADAGDHAGAWVRPEELKATDLRMVSIGVYLGVQVQSGVKNVMLAGTKSLADEHFNTCSQVPLGCVTQIVELVERLDASQIRDS